MVDAALWQFVDRATYYQSIPYAALCCPGFEMTEGCHGNLCPACTIAHVGVGFSPCIVMIVGPFGCKEEIIPGAGCATNYSAQVGAFRTVVAKYYEDGVFILSDIFRC